jgi:hypothetical protein
MKNGIIASLITGIIAASCTVKVQVKKDAKNSKLNSASTAETLKAVGPEDFLKHLDDLRTVGSGILLREFAKNDYVGSFRTSVRKYRSFIIDNAGGKKIIADSFYSDEDHYCRDSGLSLNADDHNEMLGMILKTVVLAKISETDIGKINAGLAKELQALSQFIMIELGVEITGTSTVADLNGKKVTKGNVTIKLKPIAGEKIDDATKHRDEVEVLSLNFERSLGADMIGSFASTMDLSYEKGTERSEASGSITVTRVKDGADHVHDVLMSVGVKGETPSYSREIIVRDNPSDASKYEFMDILNAGTDKESRNHSYIDLKAGKQCKGSGVDGKPDSSEKSKSTGKPASSDDSVPETKSSKSSSESSSDSSSNSTVGKPAPTNSQTPVQKPVSSTPSQMK